MGTLREEQHSQKAGALDVMNKIILDPWRVYEIQMNGNHLVCMWLYSVFLTRHYEQFFDYFDN